MAHDLYIQTAHSVSMRRCATAAVVGAIQTAFPYLCGSVRLDKGCITVDLWLPWASWWALGGAHVLVKRKAKWITAKIVRELGVAVLWRVQVHSGRPPKGKQNGKPDPNNQSMTRRPASATIRHPARRRGW